MHRLLSLVLLAACADKSSTTDDTGTDETPHAENGLPEGTSTWSGTAEVAGVNFLLSFEIENDGGDLVSEVTIADDPEAPLGIGTAIYSATGTHEPGSGLVALAPEEWIQEANFDIELLGFTGTYDPETDAITGMVIDYATPDENSLSGGPVSATRDSGDGEPTEFGALDKALPEGTSAFSGTQQCTGEQREMAGEITYDGAGTVSGTISFGDLTLADGTYTFEFTGVHNPSTGGITLVPGLYVEDEGHSYLTFFVEATYDPAASTFDGEGRVTVGSCPDDYWQAQIGG